jgi:ABC-type glycerol-3-phosphate transport system substrate-binding protein
MAMQRLTRRGASPVWGSMVDISWERIQVHVNGWGGHFVDPADPSKCLMCQPEALAAVEWLRARMWDDRIMAMMTDVEKMSTRQAFMSGRIAMTEEGSWALKDILAGASFRVGVAPFPAGPAKRVTLATTDGFGINAGCKHPGAAWELVKFLVSPSYGRAMARANFLQPARASLVDDWIHYVQAQFPGKAKDVDLAAFAEGQIKGYSVVAEVFANMADATSIASDAWLRILTLGQAPVSDLQAACARIQAAQPGGQE